MDLSTIIKVEFPENQYYKEEYTKSQIVLHHTVSGPGVNGDFNTWKNNIDRVATCVVVDREGQIHQCFSSKYWAHHLGMKNDHNLGCNKHSIGIEIDSWGGLTKGEDGKWHTATGIVVPIEQVIIYDTPFRGYRAFERYTDKQLSGVRELLLYWGQFYGIDLHYNEGMFDLNQDAISGKPGVWTHVSYRQDKSDCSPQPELISMIQNLI